MLVLHVREKRTVRVRVHNTYQTKNVAVWSRRKKSIPRCLAIIFGHPHPSDDHHDDDNDDNDYDIDNNSNDDDINHDNDDFDYKSKNDDNYVDNNNDNNTDDDNNDKTTTTTTIGVAKTNPFEMTRNIVSVRTMAL